MRTALRPLLALRRCSSPFELTPPWAVSPSRCTAAAGVRREYGRFLSAAPQLNARPLSLHYAEWRESCSLSGWLDRILREGYAIQFMRTPPPFRGVRETRLSCPLKALALRKEIASLLTKGTVIPVPRDQENSGLYSPYFLVPKKNGQMRPILDLRVLNESVAKRPFRMLTIKRLLTCVQRNDFGISIDLKDAYFHVPIKLKHRRFLRFAFEGKKYEYTRLPFGYALAPRTFSKCVEAALEPLRRRGIRILAYLDDLLVLAQSPDRAIQDAISLVTQLSQLGFAVNWEKSAPWPAQQFTYLGIHLDTVGMRARLSAPRREAISIALRAFRVSRTITALSVMSLLGLMAAAHVVVPLGLLYMRKLQRWFAQLRLDPVRHRRRLLVIPRSVKADLNHWRDPRVLTRGVDMGRVTSLYPVFTDASLTGWGGVCQAGSIGGRWEPSETRHINLLELEAVRLTLCHFALVLKDQDVLVRSDNRATVAYINRQGGVRSPSLHRLAEEVWTWAFTHLRSLRAQHIQGLLNEGADLMSRGGPREDEWRLKPSIVSLIWARFGRAQVDLFASRANTQCPLWFSLRTQDRPPLGVDAFAHRSWPRGLLYAFPPLASILPLLARVRSEGLSVILIAPDRPGAPWFPELMGMLVGGPWPIPHQMDALSQAGGLVKSPPVIGGPLMAWLLRGSS